MSDSLSKIVVAGQLITWLSWDAWSVSADLFYSDRLDARWFLVKGLLVMDSISVLCSFNLVPPSSLSYVTFLTARTWNVYMQSVISCSCLSFGCTSSVFKVFTGLTATGTWSFLITRAILSDIPSTQGRMTRCRFTESLFCFLFEGFIFICFLTFWKVQSRYPQSVLNVHGQWTASEYNTCVQDIWIKVKFNIVIPANTAAYFVLISDHMLALDSGGNMFNVRFWFRNMCSIKCWKVPFGLASNGQKEKLAKAIHDGVSVTNQVSTGHPHGDVKLGLEKMANQPHCKETCEGAAAEFTVSKTQLKKDEHNGRHPTSPACDP